MRSEPLLIVDDRPLNVKLPRLLLTCAGYEVRTAGDAEEAIKMLETYQPCLILMDIQLPGMDGLALTRQLKSDPATQHIIIIALTAYAMKGDEERARASGCAGYLTKPLDTRTLAEDVARHIDAGSSVGCPCARPYRTSLPPSNRSYSLFTTA
jgi:two-component system cell cycle response regulator DivK